MYISPIAPTAENLPEEPTDYYVIPDDEKFVGFYVNSAGSFLFIGEFMAIDNRIERARARGLYTDHELNVLWPKFLTEKASKRINSECQKKHITGTKTFENYDKNSKEKGFAGAAYFNSDIDVYGLVNQSIGTGLVVFSKAGFVKEELVQFDKEIGYAGSEKFVRTNVLSIRYANKGIHATPVHPSKYKDTINFLKKREILINDQKRKNIGNLPAVRHHQPVRVFRCFYTNIQS